MKKFIKKKTFWLSATALIMAAGLSLNGVMAYFTTYVTAKGGHPVTLGTKSHIEEGFENWTKKIVIENTGDKESWVRVKVFSGTQFPLDYSNEGGKWQTGEGDYWYYSDVLPVGEKTTELLAKITVPEEYANSFDVVVVMECTEVLYREDGTAYADWSRIADTTSGIRTRMGGE